MRATTTRIPRQPDRVVEPVPALEEDTVWRGQTSTGELELVVLRATAAVRDVVERQDCAPVVAQRLGELVVAGRLLCAVHGGATGLRLRLRQDGVANDLAVDVAPDGAVRAWVQFPRRDRAAGGGVVGRGTLEVSRLGQPGEADAVSLPTDSSPDALVAAYLLERAHVPALVRSEIQVRDGALAATGYLVRLQPPGTRETLRRLATNLARLGPLQPRMRADDPDGLRWASEALAGWRWSQTAREALKFGCDCSAARMLEVIVGLPRAEVEELAHGGAAIEVPCAWCGQLYAVPAARVAAWLVAAQAA